MRLHIERNDARLDAFADEVRMALEQTTASIQVRDEYLAQALDPKTLTTIVMTETAARVARV